MAEPEGFIAPMSLHSSILVVFTHLRYLDRHHCVLLYMKQHVSALQFVCTVDGQGSSAKTSGSKGVGLGQAAQ